MDLIQLLERTNALLQKGYAADAKQLLEAELSHDQKRGALTKALRSTIDGNAYLWTRDVYDDAVVYEVCPEGKPSQTLRRAYSIDTAGAVTLGDAVAVRAVMTYEPVESAKPTPATEASATEAPLVGDLIPLLEKAVRQDGTIPIKVIQPGWGATGYYPSAVLERDGAKAFPAGTKMYWDHPTEAEEKARPEGSLKNLAAELTTAAKWNAQGADGPGLYAEAKVFAPYAAAVEELAPHIGTSIRGLGLAREGQAEGRKGPIIERLVASKSVDFVTAAGAGGKILQLFESARALAQPAPVPTPVQEARDSMDALEEKALREARANAEAERDRLKADKATLTTDLARAQDKLAIIEAEKEALKHLNKMGIPERAAARVAARVSMNVPLKEGKVNLDVLLPLVEAGAREEMDYLGGLGIGTGNPTGMGGAPSGQNNITLEEAQKSLNTELLRDRQFASVVGKGV